MAGSGLMRMVRRTRLCEVRLGSPGKVRLVVAVPGMVWPGKAVGAWYVPVGIAWSGEAVMVRRGRDYPGWAWFGRRTQKTTGR